MQVIAVPSSHHARVHQDPGFGYDPWTGPGEPLDLADARLWAGGTPHFGVPLFAAEDTLGGDIGLLTPGLASYMSYVDNFGGFGELLARFGKSSALLVSITIFGGRARCADVEPGAMNNGDFPRWLDQTAIVDPVSPVWLYTNAGNMAALMRAVGGWKDKLGRRPIFWSAHFGFGPHVCAPHVCGYPEVPWTQWADHGPNGENKDRSLGTFLPHPQPTDPHHYLWFEDVKRIVYGRNSERATVEEYDRLRALQAPGRHPQRARIAVLRARLRAGAGRLWVVAHAQRHRGHPSWDRFHRGWRRIGLARRAAGERVV